MRTPDEIKKGLVCCVKATEEACKHCPYMIDCETFDNAGNLSRDALAYINQLESRGPKWISVKERLPEDDDDVLIRIYGKIIGVGYRINGKWKSLSMFKAPVVTHWMPLPEMPEEE